MADTDRRSLQVLSDRTPRKAANAKPANAPKEEKQRPTLRRRLDSD
jgi:hypothetical protein